MKETKFIAENKQKWSRFEQSRGQSNPDPEELGKLYSEISNDLSFAQSFYKRRTVRAYLNGLAQGVHTKLYKQKKEPFRKVLAVWTKEIPLEVYNSRHHLLFALVMFLAWATIGVASSYFDPDFAELILGRSYIMQTEQNILEGNPLGIYGNEAQSSMFFSITLNNIGVALKCFFAGVFFSIGTHIILFQNAIMVGAFQYYFKMKGLLLTSFLTIWIHGAFEISAIVIASGAGFTLGHGLLFPGSYTRLQSFRIHAKRGVRILISLIPIFVIAGFLESFVTRHYLVLPDWSKWMIILFSFAIVLFYYVVYPIIVARKYPDLVNEVDVPTPMPKRVFNLNVIRVGTEIIGETFQFYSVHFSRIFRPIFRFAVPSILLLSAFQFIRHIEHMDQTYYFNWSAHLSILFGNIYAPTFKGMPDVIVSFLWLIPITIIACAVFHAFQSMHEPYSNKAFLVYLKRKFFPALVGVSLFVIPILFIPFYIQMPLVFLFPLFLLLAASAGLGEKFGIGKGFELGSKYWTTGIGMLLFFAICYFLMAQPIAFVFSIHEYGQPMSRDLLDIVVDFFNDFLAPETGYYLIITNGIRQAVYLTALIFMLPLIIISTGFIFYSSREEIDAVGLKRELTLFGKRSRTQETSYDYEQQEN
jgi:uncharacterized membrane protein SpoIIM required for sporulation